MEASKRFGLTLADARGLDYESLLERAEAILAEFDKPDIETPQARMDRISRTLDEMPANYRWFLQLHSWCDHWTDSLNEMFGIKDKRYKTMRQRRDLFEDMASSAKMRYDGASRLITVEMGFDPTGMPRTRRG